jgi:hypothetical protein
MDRLVYEVIAWLGSRSAYTITFSVEASSVEDAHAQVRRRLYGHACKGVWKFHICVFVDFGSVDSHRDLVEAKTAAE